MGTKEDISNAPLGFPVGEFQFHEIKLDSLPPKRY